MFRKRMGMIAVAAAAGALSLTACSSTTGQSAAAPAPSAPASVSASAPNAVALQAPAQSLQVVPGTAQQNNAPANTGDLANPAGQQTTQAGEAWVELSASKAGDLDPVVVNGAGFTLYRFDKDTAQPSKSNCNADCAAMWPPVIVDPSGKLFLDGVDMKNVGAVKRDDGSMQLTIGGWPAYRFSKDLKPGDTNGQGVGGTWFGLTPDGQKAGKGQSGSGQPAGGTGSVAPSPGTGTGTDGSAGGTGTATGGSGAGGAVKAATNAVLFDDKNFADNGSQGVSGTGCQNVSRVGVASSIQTDGSLKIWTGANCTGTSKVISGSVNDLSTIGFDDKIASIRFS
jgi:predicted lipoprotein with Yx(FWY)xxD motif